MFSVYPSPIILHSYHVYKTGIEPVPFGYEPNHHHGVYTKKLYSVPYTLGAEFGIFAFQTVVYEKSITENFF